VAIDPLTDHIASTVPVGGAAVSLAAQGPELWLAVGASATEHVGGSLVLSMASGTFQTLDPSVVYDQEGWRIPMTTNDALLSYKKVGGLDGTTLVPNLATALPEVSSDGLSYRFVLRPGIRYSNGLPVRPEDFRLAIERTLVLFGSPFLYAAIDGAPQGVLFRSSARTTSARPARERRRR
jgi:peptide/nickel transport system substrate-binding protein